ncbi:hypothetical protein TTHERM_01094810 (macronuclear) [Tetrahymena thermophila SB210]|uniref:Uncharacterized protein n=1 Tax=Tetrahymena thermophila (strain SB210) TaxID=312017 RepID=Q22ZH9_TETTS|nr:hypothetical protein TTHERM_01094810 [Tetrahymena thermophila SB210]EAR90668.2 hypothetical protein TTHERM_01094810 [Tetrahymena thermophila SB210]|eukprot:XP_001010913.2 hypothetical protein TTHERM_01094810 [Tetrahymena thermophila SB210]
MYNQYQNQIIYPNQNSQNFNSQQQYQQGGYFYNNMNQMQVQPSFLNEDFFGLTDPDFGAQDLINEILFDAYNACVIFKDRKQQIESLIKSLYEKYEQQNIKNQNNFNSILSQDLQEIVNDIEKDTIKIIIEKRIINTKIVEKFQELADSFERSNLIQIDKIKSKYQALGLLNIIPEEYVDWINIIKESQQKLNIITGYSNIIQNTYNNILEYEQKINPKSIAQKLDQFEEDTIKFIQNYSD